MFHVTADELPRLMQCNGSRLMARIFETPQGDTKIRDEGIAAHHAATIIFNGVQPESLLNTKAPNGVFITPEMLDHVLDYLEALELGGNVEVETSFIGDTWSIGARADHIAEGSSTLYVDDFKYGFGAVEPEMNWTLIVHAIGHCLKTGFAPERIVLTIHQPRISHHLGKSREWVITWSELLDLYSLLVATLSNLANTLNTGPACRKCFARFTCPAKTKAGMNAIDVSEMAFDEIIDDARLSYELEMLSRAKAVIDQRLDARTEVALDRIKKGSIIEKFDVETTLTNTRWKPGISAEMLEMTTGVSLTKKTIVTPAEAKRRGVSDSAVSQLTERVPTGHKLVRRDADKKAKKLLGDKSK